MLQLQGGKPAEITVALRQCGSVFFYWTPPKKKRGFFWFSFEKQAALKNKQVPSKIYKLMWQLRRPPVIDACRSSAQDC